MIMLIINRHSIVILHFLIHAMALAAQHTHCSFSFQSFISSMIRRRPAMSGRLRGGVRKRTLWSCLQSSYFCSLFAAHHSRPCPANVSKGCWRGDAILREVKSSAGTVEFCHQRRQGFYKEVALYLIIRKPLFQIKVKKVSRWVPAWTQNARFTSGACPTMPTSKTSFTLRYFFPLRSSFILTLLLSSHLWYVKWLKNPSARPNISLFLQELLLCNLESWNFNFNPRGHSETTG